MAAARVPATCVDDLRAVRRLLLASTGDIRHAGTCKCFLSSKIILHVFDVHFFPNLGRGRPVQPWREGTKDMPWKINMEPENHWLVEENITQQLVFQMFIFRLHVGGENRTTGYHSFVFSPYASHILGGASLTSLIRSTS